MAASEIGEQASMSDTISRKTTDIFSRLEMARMESFARIRTADQSPLCNRGGTFNQQLPHQTLRQGLGSTMTSNAALNATLGGGGSVNSTSSTGVVMEPVYRDDYDAMNLEIHEDGEGNVFVKDLSLIPVTCVSEALNVLNKGINLRATHETKMNQVSSRSHTVFTITVMQKNPITGETISGTLHLVDLAGSERLKKSESQGIRLREVRQQGDSAFCQSLKSTASHLCVFFLSLDVYICQAVHINSSLTALGKVVIALESATEKTHIPYRDSKLTRILQNRLVS